MVVEIPPATHIAGGRRCWGQGSGHLPPCRAGAAQKVHCGPIVKPLFPLSLQRCRSAALSRLVDPLHPDRSPDEGLALKQAPLIRDQATLSAVSGSAEAGSQGSRPGTTRLDGRRQARSGIQGLRRSRNMRRDDASRRQDQPDPATRSEDKTNPARRNAPARRSARIFGRVLLFTHLHKVASDPMQRGTRKHPGERIQICLHSYFGKNKPLLYQEALSFFFSDLVGRAPDEVRIHRAS